MRVLGVPTRAERTVGFAQAGAYQLISHGLFGAGEAIREGDGPSDAAIIERFARAAPEAIEKLARLGVRFDRNGDGGFALGLEAAHSRSRIEVRLTGRIIEIFVKGERIAAHMRGSGNGKHTTIADHMPPSHRRYADWTVGRIPQGRRPHRSASAVCVRHAEQSCAAA